MIALFKNDENTPSPFYNYQRNFGYYYFMSVLIFLNFCLTYNTTNPLVSSKGCNKLKCSHGMKNTFLKSFLALAFSYKTFLVSSTVNSCQLFDSEKFQDLHKFINFGLKNLLDHRIKMNFVFIRIQNTHSSSAGVLMKLDN